MLNIDEVTIFGANFNKNPAGSIALMKSELATLDSLGKCELELSHDEL